MKIIFMTKTKNIPLKGILWNLCVKNVMWLNVGNTFYYMTLKLFISVWVGLINVVSLVQNELKIELSYVNAISNI